MKRYIRNIQIMMTILIVFIFGLEIIRYLDDNAKNTITGYIGLIVFAVFILLLMILLMNYFEKKKIKANKYMAFWIITIVIEIGLLTFFCASVEDNIDLKLFTKEKYYRAIAEVSNIEVQKKYEDVGIDIRRGISIKYSVT